MFNFKYFFLGAAITTAAIGWAETGEFRFPFMFFMLIGAFGAALYDDIKNIQKKTTKNKNI